MPYLSIQTSNAVSEEKQAQLLRAASSTVAAGLGKPEAYVMASFAPATRMIFAGEESPAAFLDLRAIGITPEKARSLCSALTQLVTDHCDVKPSRIYIVSTDVPAQFWGYEGAMFG
jgi:phenylpyruvate tautomerase PptA (4-oxalocrotonate tautomerase family)